LHFLDILGFLEQSVKVFDFLAKFLDLRDKSDVFCHDVLVVLLVNQIFFLKTLLQGLVRLFQVFFLVDELLLDVRIDICLLGTLTFNIGSEGRGN
jgi:hypothetical protein